MIRECLFVCLLCLLHASLLPPEGLGLIPPRPTSTDTSQSGPLTGSSLEAIQQSLLNNYRAGIQGAPSSSPDAPEAASPGAFNDSSIEAIQSRRTNLMAQYFENSGAANVDNGANNTVEGLHNIIEFGTLNTINGNENILNGSKNYINGSGNDVKGSENSIMNSKNNVVHGSGNVIMDAPGGQNLAAITTTGVESNSDKSSKRLPASPTPPDYNKDSSSASISGTPVNSNLSNQFDRFFALGSLLILLHLLLQ